MEPEQVNLNDIYNKADIISKKVGINVRKRRLYNKWSQQYLAEKMRTDKSLISNMENGHMVNMTIITLIKVAEVFKVAVQDLMV